MRIFSRTLAKKPQQCCRNCFPSVTEIISKNRCFFWRNKHIFLIFFGSRSEIVGMFANEISAGLFKLQSTCRPKPFEAFVFLRKQYICIYFRIFRKTSLNFWRSNIGRVVRNTLYVSRGRF